MDPSGVDDRRTLRVALGASCRALACLFERSGVSDLVISPGSRNTPLIMAALERSDLTLHSVIDERAAGFFAVGLAKAKRRPVALLCTSGSAGAHYLPAIVEAYYSQIPLLVLTADRPTALQNCGAPQTIDQHGLYSSFTIGETLHVEPRFSVNSPVAMCEKVARALSSAWGPRPGPVHVNVRLDKPLEWVHPKDDDERQLVARWIDAAREAPLRRPSEPPLDEASLEIAAAALDDANRPLLTCGPLPPEHVDAVTALARRSQIPILGEFSLEGGASGLEFFPPLLQGSRAPDVILHIGPPCVSGSWAEYIDDFQGRYFVAPGTQLKDPSRKAEQVCVASLEAVTGALQERLKDEKRAVWTDFVDGESKKVKAAIESALDDSTSSPQIGDPTAVLRALSRVPSGGALLLGNSLPIRVASWVWAAASVLAFPHTMRGANGIDGCIAVAAGICEATQGPTMAILGDVTALHDVGSLALLQRLRHALVLVVIDNDGGRIFDHLPVRQAVDDPDFDFWTTPTRVDFQSLARAFSLGYALIDDEANMKSALDRVWDAPRPTLLHVRTQPESSRRFVSETKKGLAS